MCLLYAHTHTHTHFVLPMHHTSDHQLACMPRQTLEPYHCSTESNSQNLHFNKPKFKMASNIIHKTLNTVALQPIFLRGKAPTIANSRGSFKTALCKCYALKLPKQIII